MPLMLTSNAIVALNNGDVELRPVLQIVDIRQIGNAQTTTERFRLVLSDGVHLQQAMLATQLNEKVKNNLAVKGSIVQLLEYICNTVQNRKIIIVLNMEIVESKAEIIGDPKHLNAGGEQQASLPGPGPGPGSLQQPQQLQQPPPARVSAPSSVTDAANNGSGFRSAGGGLGQTLGTGLDNGAGGFNMGQAPSAGGYNPYASEVEIDMEISDDEGESLKGRAVAAQVVDGIVAKHNSSPAGPTITEKADSSRKRKRFSPEETSPSVRVEYRNFSRESRRKLQELLRDWSLWQGYHSRRSSSESRDNLVESGEEEYYPALQVGPVGSSFSVSFWVDKPTKQSRSKESGDSRGIVRTSSQDLRDSEVDVPLYDRVTPSLSTQESRKDGCVEVEREAIRCFNCGSYSHGLRDCQRQLNYDAINSARSSHASRRTFSSGPRTVTRYYETNANNEEPDRAPWQLHQTSPCNPGKEASRSSSSSEKKEEKNKKLPSTEDNEEGEIVDAAGSSSCVEEELYIAFGPDPVPQADRTALDYSQARVPFNSVPERMWRSPPAAFSPPIQMHPNFHNQRSFAYPPQNPVYSHTPPPVHHHGGMNPQRSWDERHPQRPWDGRNLYYPENHSSPATNGSSAPIAIPAPKKEEDDWELNFESSVHQSESSRLMPGAAEHFTPSVRYPALTVNTISGFSPPDPSQLSPTGSGYGDSFRPSPAPQTSVQYHISYLSPQVREPSYSVEAWEKAQAALSSLQSDEKGVGC